MCLYLRSFSSEGLHEFRTWEEVTVCTNPKSFQAYQPLLGELVLAERWNWINQNRSGPLGFEGDYLC